MNTPFNKNDGWRFEVKEKFHPYWVSKKAQIMTKHPSWEESLIKLSDNKIMRPSVGDVADIVVLNDWEMILLWGGSNRERFVRDSDTGIYHFQRD